MAAKITSNIPPDLFELIRDQIGAILSVELTEQAVLDVTFTAPAKVWLERFVPYNVLTETPGVNVRFSKGDALERSRERTQTTYIHTYFIECTVNAKSTGATTGDQIAKIKLHQLIRKVRSILSNPLYKKLALDIPIARCYVNGIEVFEAQEFDDATNKIDGWVEFCVEVPEYAANPVTGAILNDITTTVRLNKTEEGYFWEVVQKQITVGTSGATLTDAFFSNTISEIDVAGNVYLSGTDFTQAGTTITATTFEFTAAEVITAKV